MNRPMNSRLVDSIRDINDLEKKKQAIIIEFLPDHATIKKHHLATLDQLTKQVMELETALGKQKRLTSFTYELDGLNIRTAIAQMHQALVPLMEDKKPVEKLVKDNSDRWNAIVTNTEKKFNFEANKIPINKIIQISNLYELFKGLMKYENIIDRSLTLYRSYEKISSDRQDKQSELMCIDERNKNIIESNKSLQTRLQQVSNKIKEAMGEINALLSEVENTLKTKLK